MERNRAFTSGSGNGSASEESTRAIHELSSEMNEWVDSLDLQQLTRRVQDFGREKPVALALAALTVGVAAGLLMKKRAPLS